MISGNSLSFHRPREGNRRGGAEGGGLTGLVLSGSRLCRAEAPGLARSPDWDSGFIPHTLVAPGSSFCIFSENGASQPQAELHPNLPAC